MSVLLGWSRSNSLKGRERLVVRNIFERRNKVRIETRCWIFVNCGLWVILIIVVFVGRW